MAYTYRLILIDEFDWNYLNFRKDMARSVLSRFRTPLIIEAEIPYMMIVDCGTALPSQVLAHIEEARMPYDESYAQECNGPLNEIHYENGGAK